MILSTLNERGTKYGKFSEHAALTQALKDAMYNHPDYGKLEPNMMEALDMIQHKIGRIINGDPYYADSWHDIAGYATLVERKLQGEDI